MEVFAMKFQLFLKEITQEMIDAGRIARQGGDWSGNVWSKSCCIINFMKKSPKDLVVLPQQGDLLLRSEPDGGLVWSPTTNAVYKLDDEAYRVMRDLDSGYTEREAAKRNSVTLRAVRGLIDKVNTEIGAQVRK
jgi:hypothetical protein